MLENIKKQLISIFIAAVVFMILTLLFVFLADPFKISGLAMVAFYLALSGFVISILTLLLYGLRGRIIEGNHAPRMNTSVRQAFWLTLLIVGSLVLSSHQLLFWWLEVIFILTLVMIEGYFLSSN